MVISIINNGGQFPLSWMLLKQQVVGYRFTPGDIISSIILNGLHHLFIFLELYIIRISEGYYTALVSPSVQVSKYNVIEELLVVTVYRYLMNSSVSIIGRESVDFYVYIRLKSKRSSIVREYNIWNIGTTLSV
jgi:phosphate starvation-inducible membrane PsiE